MEQLYTIMNDKAQRQFIRMNPAWYKEINRRPESYEQFKQQFDIAKKEATPSKLQTVDKHLNLARAMLKLVGGIQGK